MKRKFHLALVIAGIAILISGCSGSSSSSASNAPSASKVTITADNQKVVANMAMDAASQNIGKSYAGLVGGAQASTTPSNERILSKAAEFALQRMALSKGSSATVTGVATTNPCLISGTATEDIGANYYKADLSNCQDTVDGPITNGHIYITNVVTTPDFNADLDFNLTMSLSGNTFGIVGGFNLNETGLGTPTRTDTMSGASIVVSVNTMSVSLTNFNFVSVFNDDGNTPVINTDNINYTVAFVDTANTAYNFIFSVATTQIDPIVTYYNPNDSYPRSGQFVVTGDASTALRVTILTTAGAGTADGQLTLELSTNNGASWSTPQTTTWATL